MAKPVFIYCLKCPTTGDVRYIGQTNNLKRRFSQHCSTEKKTHLGNWLRSLFGPPILTVLHEVAEDESWAEEERRYISCAKAIGMDLVNGTDGGDGASGHICTPETRARMSAALTGVPLTPEHCEAIRAGKMGVLPTPEHRASLSAAHTGVPLSPEHCATMRVPKPPRSPEHCAALSSALKGKPASRDSIDAAHTPEANAKRSVSMKLVWAKKKGEVK